MAVPSSPGWKFGYVPSPGEWNNTFAGKVDFPAPLNQGGTGGQSAFDGNYNLQQRSEVITPVRDAAALTFYSVRTDLTATTIRLPASAVCKAGDWIDVFDAGANASANNITIAAAAGNVVMRNASSASTLILRNNGTRCILVTDGIDTWRAQTVGPFDSSGGGAGPFAIEVPVSFTEPLVTRETLPWFPVSQDIVFPVNFAGSTFVVAGDPPTASMTLTVESYYYGIIPLGSITILPDRSVTAVTAGSGPATARAPGGVRIKGPFTADSLSYFIGALKGSFAS